MKRIAVVGSANMDLVVRVPSFPEPGETLLGATFGEYSGGKGANQAVALGQLESEPWFVGKIGGDAFGERLRKELYQNGVNVEHVAIDNVHPTGVAIITVNEAAENWIVVASGANMELTDDEVRRALDHIRPDVVLCQLEVSLNAVVAASQFGGTFILNPAPATSLPRELLEMVDFLTPNETEAANLTGIDTSTFQGCVEAARALIGQGVGAVIVTRGAEGGVYVDPNEVLPYRPYPVTAIDTTAAGDAFNGGFARFLDEGVEVALQKAAIVAALSTTMRGAQPSMPPLAKVLEAYKSFI